MKFEIPVKLNENVYWIGCGEDKLLSQNVYLLKDEDVGVLIDPAWTQQCFLQKAKEVMDLKDIKYVIVQNYEPDTIKMLEKLKELIPDITLVTHWKIAMFLNKFKLDIKKYIIDENDWKLKLKTKELDFIFTPFNYFSGSFCTYDSDNNTLFSGELFSAVKNKFQLFVDKENVYLYSLKMFHQLYLPVEYMHKALKSLPRNLELVAPKYGSLLEGDFIQKAKEELLSLKKKDLEEYKEEIISKLYEDLMTCEIDEALERLYKNIKNAVNISSFHAYVMGDKYFFGEEGSDSVDVMLYVNESPLVLSAGFEEINKEFLRDLLRRAVRAIGYVIERQVFKDIQNNPILDTITGVFSKEYLPIVDSKILKQASRHKFPVAIGLIEIDYDHKHIGKLYKECILREIAKLLQRQFRSSDILIRDEDSFLIFMPFTDSKNASLKLQRVVNSLNSHLYCGSKKMKINASYKVSEYDKVSSIYSEIEKLKNEVKV